VDASEAVEGGEEEGDESSVGGSIVGGEASSLDALPSRRSGEAIMVMGGLEGSGTTGRTSVIGLLGRAASCGTVRVGGGLGGGKRRTEGWRGLYNRGDGCELCSLPCTRI
jgi:hypothetical protein